MCRGRAAGAGGGGGTRGQRPRKASSLCPLQDTRVGAGDRTLLSATAPCVSCGRAMRAQGCARRRGPRCGDGYGEPASGLWDSSGGSWGLPEADPGGSGFSRFSRLSPRAILPASFRLPFRGRRGGTERPGCCSRGCCRGARQLPGLSSFPTGTPCRSSNGTDRSSASSALPGQGGSVIPKLPLPPQCPRG